MFPRVILKGTLIKKSQQKRRTSPCNYKERYFELNTQNLKYLEHRSRKSPMVKGCIELVKIKCVEIVCSDVRIPCNNKYPFQVYYDNHYLYIFAPDNICRQQWVRALKEETRNNDLVAKYHPNFWMEGKWRCCQQTEKQAAGCHVYNPEGFVSNDPLPEIPDPERRPQDADERTVIALQNYTPLRDKDLPLEKDQKYVLINTFQSDWWTVKNSRGEIGFAPSPYVAKTSGDNFERFGWYNKNITRGEAEDLLMKEGKEGAFMVRDSRQAGVYTVSVFTQATGSKGAQDPRVKHYRIRLTETGETAFFLAENYLFSTIPQLIHYHQHNAAGLVTRLRGPVSQDGSCSVDIADPLRDQWEIDPEELTLGEELGSGNFGLVLEGTWKERKVAVKTARENIMSEDEFKDEARVMMRMSHCKLVQLYGVCTKRSPMCLVFEFMDKGCLSDYLHARRGHLSQDVMLGMCLDVSEGMAYLESSNFIHRDLAARNCLVSHNREVKVSDFGMTRFVLDDQYTSSLGSKFCVKWSAPEVIRYSRFSSKSDVWSFGVLMWEVYNEGRRPYESRSNSEVLEALDSGLRLPKPRLVPDEVHLLMEWCWKEIPEYRPSFAVLLHELAAVLHV